MLAWHILAVNLGEYYADKDPKKSLEWNSKNPLALRNRASQLLESDPNQAVRLLEKSIWQNPVDARSYLMLGLLREKAGDFYSARKLVNTALNLSPRQWPLRLEAAGFWIRQQQPELAVKSWNVALQMKQGLSKEIFPYLLNIAQNPNTIEVFEPIVRYTPNWWSNFFIYATENATRAEVLNNLYHMKRELSLPSKRERNAFVTRLQEEGYWTAAYEVWLNGLNKNEKKVINTPFNGGFEIPLEYTGGGFDWSFLQPKGVKISTAATYGIEGGSALRITFSGKRVQFRHFTQPMLLPVGHYEMQGKVRLDNLETAKGMQWKMYCIAPEWNQIGESQRFIGANSWQLFNFSFYIPDDKSCEVQLLRLELLGHAPADFAIKGTIWFDSLAIRQVEEENIN
ncbi:tetratricopeptide repeat protein [Candidatus Nitrosacidococcus sp. I8]|uniref:tetratricopeptide repeat protein n=1 Tax=Candidatus Nitrosacidococcus sp. I8 TaxID=2942908 RepID=UPI002227F07F|nr:hypothetical protein [Candidatus Nitrosacidococcus sp. I8]